jgi:uncharacterized protein YodC (DUF2158 family)
LLVWAGKIEFAIRRKIMAQQEDNGINIGVVRLKSGGQKMTIEKIELGSSSNTENFAHCIWFDKEGGIK